MLTEKEKQFITRWEQVREKEGSVLAKLLYGLPMAMLFGLPILLFIAVVYFVSPDWYTKVSNRLSSSLGTIFIAVFICILFYAYFRMHYKWEMNEQLYHELKRKANNEEETTKK